MRFEVLIVVKVLMLVSWILKSCGLPNFKVGTIAEEHTASTPKMRQSSSTVVVLYQPTYPRGITVHKVNTNIIAILIIKFLILYKYC
jgi:hypothetical protein